MRDLSLHLIDIIQNSISADSSKITVSVNGDKKQDMLNITISDNGRGMDQELLNKVMDPFTTTRTTRKVGLGIPLFRFAAQRAGGDLTIWSEKNIGTDLKASFRISSIDRPPLGNISETLVTVIMAKPDIEFELLLESNERSFRFNSFEVKEKLGEVPITQYEVISWIHEFIDEGINTTFGGVLDEINS